MRMIILVLRRFSLRPLKSTRATLKARDRGPYVTSHYPSNARRNFWANENPLERRWVDASTVSCLWRRGRSIMIVDKSQGRTWKEFGMDWLNWFLKEKSTDLNKDASTKSDNYYRMMDDHEKRTRRLSDEVRLCQAKNGCILMNYGLIFHAYLAVRNSLAVCVQDSLFSRSIPGKLYAYAFRDCFRLCGPEERLL